MDDLAPIRQQQNGFMLSEFIFGYSERSDLDGRSSSNPGGELTIIDVTDLQIARSRQNAIILEIGPPSGSATANKAMASTEAEDADRVGAHHRQDLLDAELQTQRVSEEV